jgi:hypothetical protein
MILGFREVFGKEKEVDLSSKKFTENEKIKNAIECFEELLKYNAEDVEYHFGYRICCGINSLFYFFVIPLLFLRSSY